MGKFRKKPIVIEAEKFQLLGDLRPGDMFMLWPIKEDERGIHLIIPTLEGDHRADLGDVIIKGVKGEYYPCKPDIFEATYDDYEEVTGSFGGTEVSMPVIGKAPIDYSNPVRIPFLNDFTRKCEIRSCEHSPNRGGGRHHYVLRSYKQPHVVDYEAYIDFQEGALTEVGHNGLFSVALLAVLIDHLQSFQEGEFATRQAGIAVTNLEQAQHWLCARADERAARGVLGQHEK